MHTVKLKIEDDIYQNVMFLLSNLKDKGLEIEEEQEENCSYDIKTKIKSLLENKKTELFSSIDDPMQWQKKQRDEW